MQECDLIMKGGITSGVVYPHALVEVSKDYRLRNIGGTSAGAIAAVFAAAAEYRRQRSGGTDNSGFVMIGELAGELGSSMQTMFQPTESLRPLFDILIASVSEQARTKGKFRSVLRAAAGTYRGRLVLATAAISASALLGWFYCSIWLILFGVLLVAVLLVASLAMSFGRMVLSELPANDFGLCTGKAQPGYGHQGFADWIADKIDLIAGNVGADGRPGAPLTVGQLEALGIKIATMTTDLSSQRPYQLPLRTAIHYFSKREFLRLLPERVVHFMVGDNSPVDHGDDEAPKDLYSLPVGDDFPVLLVARMSLSFPGLISAISLYRHDDLLAGTENGKPPVRRCCFSDGGISSNFPIHFFDALAPVRPTFGIALGAWKPDHFQSERVDLPTRGRQSTALPVQEIGSMAGFLFAILNTAKDWQDTMQSMLPGYADRIVTIRLDESKEGGLNLAMDRPTIDALVGYGRQAGVALRERFSYGNDPDTRAVTGFDQHRYNRAISLLPELEDALVGYATALRARPVGAPAQAMTGLEILTEFDTEHYKNSNRWRTQVFAAFAGKLESIGRDAEARHRATPPDSVRDSKALPSVDTVIRLVAQADRVPR